MSDEFDDLWDDIETEMHTQRESDHDQRRLTIPETLAYLYHGGIVTLDTADDATMEQLVHHGIVDPGTLSFQGSTNSPHGRGAFEYFQPRPE